MADKWSVPYPRAIPEMNGNELRIMGQLDRIIDLLERQQQIMEGPCDCAAEQLRYPRCLDTIMKTLIEARSR